MLGVLGKAGEEGLTDVVLVMATASELWVALETDARAHKWLPQCVPMSMPTNSPPPTGLRD